MTAKEIAAWFATFADSETFDTLTERPVAYFCAEYALDDRIPTFAGGLGVLAGDVVREAADQGLPFVAVGLYYRQGYVCETHGNDPVTCDCVEVDPQAVGLEMVTRKDGTPLIVSVPIADQDVLVRAWRWVRAGVSVYLLDTAVDGNNDPDRGITARLYVGDKETRIKQELVLGIGGLRLIEALGIHPSVYHLNEGHSAFLAFELVRHQMQERKIGFDEARQFARRRIVLTNHTLLPAGNEIFSNDLAALVLERYASELQVPVADLVKIGLVQDSSKFSMTMLALRMTSIINAVSKLHAKKAREIWADHPMVAITNGIHVPTWDSFEGQELESKKLWNAHLDRKDTLLKRIKTQTGRDWDSETLLIGWARRITTYKRPLAVLAEVERLAAIARAKGRPVRFVFAGKTHPSDTAGALLRQQIIDTAKGPLSDIICYLPGYDLATAKDLVAGCDVWLNTPVVGFEASGTSGMKAALNGVLPCSTKDGWVDEIDTLGLGWMLDSVRITQSFLEILESDIVPMFYERDTKGLPLRWIDNMGNCRRLIIDQFSASRMLKDYVQMLYT